MKQETGKKSKKLLLIVIAVVALLAAAAVALVLILGNAGKSGQNDPAGETPASAVYWNLDRIKYTEGSETGLSTREAGEDGMFAFRFVVDGKVVELKTADKQLVNYIDMQDAMGLVLDENGFIVDALSIKDVAIEAAKEFYVKRTRGANLTVNSSVAMNGLDLTLGLTETVNIIDVRPNSETIGQTAVLEVMDVVSIYCNLDGEVTDVFLNARTESSPLYVRTSRYYKNGETSRTPDENGVYTIAFAINGEIQQLKCKDKELVTSIDYGRDANAVMGLEFDEEGYIVKKLDASGAIRGKLLCDGFNIVSVNGEEFEVTRLMSGSQQGASATFTLTENTTIVMMEDGCGYAKGQLLDGLKKNDRVAVWTDMDNNALFVKLDRRTVEDPDVKMYYSPTRYYIYRDDRSYRTADEYGYYNFDVVCEGKVSTVKTKDKDLVYKMDKNEYQFFGLKVEKGIVKEYYDPNCLTGGSSLTQRYVVDSMATIVRLVYTSNFSDGANYMMSNDIVVYDMTGYIGKLGSKTTLQVGDRVISQTDVEGKLTHVFVLDRPASGTKFYYNADRKYSSTQKSTTRTPDAEGYYVFTMFCEGKEVTVKTKNKDHASLIDLQEAPICALKVNKSGIITGAYAAIAGQPYTTKSYSYNYIEKVDFDKSLTGYTFSGGQKVYNNASYQLADDCKIYNVSNNFKSHRGEKTTIKQGDRIQALYSYDSKKITHVWVMSRMVDTPLYSNPYPKNSSSGTTRTPDAEGYYSVELFVDGELKTLRTKNKSIMDTIEKYGDNEDFFAAVVEGDIIKSVDSYNASKRAIKRLTVNFDITKISGKTITTERLRPGQSNTGDTSTFKITSKTKIYDTCSYSENRFAAVKLKVGDRVTVFADENNNVNYVFVTSPNTHEAGYMSKCPHCNKKVFWEPWTGNFISTAEEAHYYLPVNYRRNRVSNVGSNPQTSPNALRYTAVLDLNGKTFTSYNTRNLTVYSNLVLLDTVGGGAMEALGTSGGAGGNIYVDGGSVEINDGITLRMYNSASTKSSAGGNVYVLNNNVKDQNDKVVKTYTGKLTINDAVLDGWSCYSGNILMNAGTVLNLNGGIVKNGNIELLEGAKFNWKGGKIESNLTINGGVQALSGKPDFTGVLMNTNGGKVDISNLSTEASIKALPTGVFTTESDNVDAYLSVFTSALPSSCTISKAGKALTAGESLTIPKFTDNLEFVSGTQTAICPACEYLVTWQPITDAQKLQTGTHYYLANDITYTGSGAALDLDARGAVSCLHLNGHNLTATKHNAIYMGGYLNIMGSGIVTGNRAESGRGATLHANSAATNVNIYSGTYVKYSESNSTPVVGMSNNGIINIYENAKIDGSNASGTGVWLSRGVVNVYGGEICGGKEGYAILAAGDSTEPVINIYGGLVKAGNGYSIGATAKDNLKPKLNIAGGNFVGMTPVTSDADIQISGAVKMDHLFVNSGTRITLGQLTEGADITVDGELGIFTNPSENAAEYLEKQYIKPLFGKLLEVQENALVLLQDPNVFPADPEIPEQPALLEVDNSNLVFETGTTNAKCPVCNAVVTWIPVTGRTVMEPGNHYYLAQDITHTASNTALELDKRGSAVCLHLNGHNLTATAHNAIYLGGYINIMGNGTVSGNRNTSGRGVTLDGNSGATNAHIYGGTYTKYSATNTLHILGLSSAGTVSIYKGAKFDASGTTGTAVRTSRGTINIYGGEIYGGSDGYAALAASGTYTPTINVFGGLIQAGEGYSVGATASAENKANLNFYGGNIVGQLTIDSAANVIIGGTAKMDKLIIEGGCKFTLTEMSEGASIAVMANGIFTSPSNFAKTYVNYFTGLGGCPDPTVVDGALFTEVSFDPNADFTAPLSFTEGTKAKCLYCSKTVEWIAISEITAAYELEAGKHYYLTNDITAAVSGKAITYTNTDSIKCACLHLNGHNLANTQGVAIYTNGTLSIMGNGRVSGNELEANCGATVAVSGPTAKLNLLSGTYVKASDNTVNSIAAVYSAGGTINMYNAAVIDGTGLSSKSVPTCVRLNGTKGDEIKKAVLNIYGGTIQNGTITNQNGGNIRIFNNGEINMYGGLITGGKATATSGYGLGGNIYSEVGQINILGGAISNGVGRIGGNIAIKACTLTIENASVIGGSTIEGATAPHGGNISLDEKATLNVKSGAVIANGLAYNQGGNIRCVNSTINMTGGEIYGGEAKSGNQNHNVWLTSTSTMNFSGGTITGRATATVIGGAIFVVTGSKLNLSGTATVIDNCDYAGIRVAAEDLTYDSNWTGSANVAHP